MYFYDIIKTIYKLTCMYDTWNIFDNMVEWFIMFV